MTSIIFTCIGIFCCFMVSFIIIDWRLRKIENTLIDMEADRERMQHALAKEFERIDEVIG